jgi:hypothetical protein
MKIDTVSKAFIVNALLTAATTSLILETRLRQGITKPRYSNTFVLTFVVNIVMFYIFTVVIGNSLARSMYG